MCIRDSSVPVRDTLALCLLVTRCACSKYTVPRCACCQYGDWLFLVAVLLLHTEFWPWSRFICLCLTVRRGDKWPDVCVAHQVWKNDLLYQPKSVFLLHVKFMRSLKQENIRSSIQWKEKGTAASIVDHCYNADYWTMKVSNKFENGIWFKNAAV